MRKKQFAIYTNITANNNLYFTNRTEEVDQGGKKLKKLFVTLHIRNVTMEDDSQYGSLGRYECHAYAVGDPVERRHGFNVIVISGIEIPRVSVHLSKANVLQHGDNITIVCNLTGDWGNWSTSLTRISWYKDGKLKRDVENPDKNNPTLGPLVITSAGVRDGGNYTCLLEVLLRSIKEHNVSASSMIKILPWLDKPKEDLEFETFKGDSVSFECGAKGFPLQVEWKFQKQGEDTLRPCLDSKDGKYRIHRSGIYSPYVLTVSHLQYSDCGSYHCCLPSNRSDNVSSSELLNNCQRFVLWVKEACRKKPNLVAIIEGGAEVVRGHNKNVTLNASLTYDPDVGPGNHSGMTFTWHYGVIMGNYSSPFAGLNGVKVQYFMDMGNASVIIYETTGLSVNRTYLVKLAVTKDYRKSSVFQIVQLVNGDPPKISQSCLINCGAKISPSVKLSVQSQCQGSQCSKINSYEWVLYEQNMSAPNTDPVWQKMDDLQRFAITPINLSNIVIQENSFDGGKNYRLMLFVRTTDGLPGMCAYDISTASPPKGGRCTINPSSGISLNTDFNLSCSDWITDVTPLTYQFQYQLDNGLYSMVYNGLNNTVISWLPPGNRSDNYKVHFLITVINKYGASAPTMNLFVRVEPSQLLNPENITSFLTANDSLFNQVLKDGDLNKAAQIANTLLQAILQDSTLSSAEKIKIQEFVIKNIVALQVKNLPELLQTSSVIGSAIQDAEAVSVKSLKFSLSAIDTMVSLLWKTAQFRHVDDLPLITQSAENLGSCLNSVLKAGAIIASGTLGSNLQKQGKKLVASSMEIISIIADAVLALKVPDEEMTSIKTTELSMTLGRYSPSKLVSLTIAGGDGKFVLPDEKETFESSTSDTRFVDSQMLSIPFNPFTWDDTRKRVNSYVLALDLKDDARKLIKVSDLSKDIVIVTPLKPQQISLQIPQYFTQNDNLRFHQIYVEYENTLLMLEITPQDVSVSLFVYIRYGQRPTTQVHDLNATISRKETCIWTTNGHEDIEGKTKCSSNGFSPVPIETVAWQPGRYFIGVQSYNTSVSSLRRQKRSCFGNRRQKRSCVEVKDPPPTPPQSENVTVVPAYDPVTAKNYTLRVALGSCVYWSEEQEKWTTDGCRVLSATLNGFLNCSCNHLTSFGGSLFVKPNPIDFDQVLVEFKRLGDTGNVAVIVTVAVVILCYAVVVVIVRKADKEDVRNNCSPVELPTAENNVHEYEIMITTGVWRNSGTTANVAIEIYGADESTGIIQLGRVEPGTDETLFSRGNTDIFVLKADKSLGAIQGVRIGHDNNGNSPSWFLEEIVVLDKQANRSWTFRNSQWLALERGDGRIERVLVMEHNKTDFSSEVLKRWWKGITEKHIWVSVIAKPRRNRFARVQRATCCLSLLLTAMLANAMFYKLDGKSEHVIQIGPLKFSWRQVVIGIESAIIVAPVNILIVLLFRKGAENTESNSDCCSKAKWLTYLAWFLSFCSCAVSATFTIFYSLVWGKDISEQWLSSMFISFTQDVAITEPVKVFFTAIFLASIIRRKNRKHDDYECLEEAKTTSAKERLWAMKLSDVEEMRRRQAKKQNVSRLFVELFVYLIFVFLLMVVCYGNRNDHRYMMTKSIRDGLPEFETVLNRTQYWSWVANVFFPGVFAGKWYNGQQENQTMYIGNKCSVLVGMARGRQLRVKQKSCEVLDYMKHMFPVCYGEYSSSNEDKTAFSKPGWKPTDNSTNRDELFQLCPKPWRYQDAKETDTVPKWGQFSFYPGGGFVVDFGYGISTGFSITEELQKNAWLDRQTRAIILEFSAFNPTTNLLGIATYFYEIDPCGYSAPFTRTEVIPLHSTDTGSRQFYLICILLFIIFVVLYLGRDCYRLYKQRARYFKSFWSWVEIFQVIFSVLAVVMYIVRSDKAASTIQELQKNIYANVSFQEVIIWFEAENAVLGILTFIVTAKLLRLVRFNQHVVVFSKTLKTSTGLLSSFSVVLLICFAAFLHFGVLIFGTGSKHYSSILRATYFQLELTLGRVKARPINELADANDTFGRIFAALLLLSLTIVAMNFFIAIMNDALIDAKSSTSKNELYDLVDEDWRQNEEKNKIFDSISKSISRQRKEEEKSVKLKTELKNLDEKSTNKRSVVNFNLISKGIVASRQENVETDEKPETSNTRRKSLFDKVSGYIWKLFASGDENNKKEQTSSRQKQVRFSEDIVRVQLRKLRKQKTYLVQRLDDIVQGYVEEEEKFQLLCHEVGVSSPKLPQNARETANESFV